MAAPVEAGERHEQEVRIDGGRLPRAARRIDIAPERVGSPGRHRRKVSGDPRPTTTGRAVANPPRRAPTRAERVRLVAQRVKGGDGPGRQRRARRNPSLARRRLKAARRRAPSPPAGREHRGAGPPSDRRWSGSKAIRRSETLKNRARSRDGRWTVIPGAYVSRWEPCAEAHEPRQGQPPWGSYGPEECCPDAPPSSAGLI